MTLQERIDRIQKSIDAVYEDIKWIKEHSASAGHCKKYQINTDQLIANQERIIAMYGQVTKGLPQHEITVNIHAIGELKVIILPVSRFVTLSVLDKM